MNSPERRKLLSENRDVHLYMGKGFRGHVKTHSHTFYHIILVLTGTITQQQYGRTYHQLPGALFFTPPDTPHSLFIPDRNTTYYCISYSENLIDSFFASHIHQKKFLHRNSPCVTPDKKTQNLLISMLDCFIENQTHGESSSFLREAIAESFIKIAVGNVQGNFFGKTKEKQEPGTAEIKNCIRYIENNYATIKSLSELTLFTGLSKTILCKLFHKETNMTVHQYITVKRIHEAARMIHLQKLSFSDIAHLVGYDDYSTFYRNFVQVAKMSPSKYRQLINPTNQNQIY
jgi:AraC-like DNA-binding protein